MDDTVSLVKCESYADVGEAVKKAVSLIGGMDKFIKPGDKVLIKPNFVSKKNPEEAVTTHPDFLRAVIQEVYGAGGVVTVAESPGGPYNSAALKGVYSVCKAYEAVSGTEAELNFDTSFSEVKLTEGKTIKGTTIINPVLNADKIISLPKLKTHSMTAYTGAVKNLFGVIPGTHKAELHFRLDDRDAFCSMLVDLYEFVKPTLSIMDGVWGMDGNGPTAGRNRNIGVVIAGSSGHAVDIAGSRILGFKPREIATLREALDRGLVSENIDIKGENIETLILKDVLKPESHFNLLKLLSLPESVNKLVVKILSAKPKVNYSECVGCGECMRRCPPKAIEMKNKKPVIDDKKCIKCFCCQELCPKKAVKIHRSVINKFMLKFLK